MKSLVSCVLIINVVSKYKSLIVCNNTGPHYASSWSSSCLTCILQPLTQVLVLSGHLPHVLPSLLQTGLEKIPLLLLLHPPHRQTFKSLLHHQVRLTQGLWETEREVEDLNKCSSEQIIPLHLLLLGLLAFSICYICETPP